MPRAVDGTRRKERRKKILKLAKGYRGKPGKLFKIAKDSIAKALMYAYRDRRNRKRDFRALWITRISAGCRQHEINYSQFLRGLRRCGIQINRKALSNMAIEDSKAFAALVQEAKTALERELHD